MSVGFAVAVIKVAVIVRVRREGPATPEIGVESVLLGVPSNVGVFWSGPTVWDGVRVGVCVAVGSMGVVVGGERVGVCVIDVVDTAVGVNVFVGVGV